MTSRAVVIGGGLVGCLVALRLADAGFDVVVLEKSHPGAEASSAAAGILAGQADSHGPGALFDLAIESRAMHHTLAQEILERTGVSVGLRRCGVLELASTDADLQGLRAKLLWQRDAGHRVETLDAREVRALEASLSDGFVGGVHIPDDGALDTVALMHGVSQAAARAGVRVDTGVLARRVAVSSGRVQGVDTDDGRVEGDLVVVCAGALSGLVEGALTEPSRVRPARGQVVALRTRPVPIGRGVFARGGYLVPKSAGRVLVGSTMEFVGYQRGVTARGVARLLDVATGTVPSLGDALLEATWSGFRPYASDGAPCVGVGGAEGLLVATGHHRSGILLAPVTAAIVTEFATTGRSTRDVALLRPLRDAPSNTVARG